MSGFQKILIVVLGIILSFLLFSEGEKYLESTDYGQIIENCQKSSSNCESTNPQDLADFKQKYGLYYSGLKTELKEQRSHFVIPVILLIITLFVSFTLDKEEVLISTIVIMPFLGSLIVKFFFGAECCLVPFYLLYVIFLSFGFSFIKRVFWKLNP